MARLELYYNNTFTGRLGGLTSEGGNQGSNAQFYNDLVLGHDPGEELVEIGTFTNCTALDYNGYRPNDGATNNLEFDSPAFGTAADYNTADPVKRQTRRWLRIRPAPDRTSTVF